MKKIFAFILVFIGLVTGCKSATNPVVTDSDFPQIEDKRSEEYKENSFTTLNGDVVKYNQNTRKIVCTFGSLDVVAFGIHVLAYEASTNIEGIESYYLGSSQLVYSAPISPEEIMSYDPELILVNEKMGESTIKQLSNIAPVIPLYTDSTNFEQRLSYIGEIFGMNKEAKQLINYANDLRISMVNRINNLGLENKTVTLFTYMGGISIPPERGWFMNTIIYDYCSMRKTKIVDDFMNDESVIAYNTISSEKIKDYEGDLVIYAGFGETTISTYVSENPGWMNLDAVKENRVGILDITLYQQKGIVILYNQYLQVLNALKVAGQVDEAE